MQKFFIFFLLLFSLAISDFACATEFESPNFKLFKRAFYTSGEIENPVFIEERIKIEVQKRVPFFRKREKVKLVSIFPVVTVDELRMATRDVKRVDAKIMNLDDDMNFNVGNYPQARYNLKKYNRPAGSNELDLTTLKKQYQINAKGIANSQGTKLVYSSVFHYKHLNQTHSEVYLINLNDSDTTDTLKHRIMVSNILQREYEPIISTNLSEIVPNFFKTLTVVDWNKAGDKIAVKERVGLYGDGFWETHLIVYDFNLKRAIRLDELRVAIEYWWKQNKKIKLREYRWDIIPVGWESEEPDCVLAYAFLYGKNKELISLGTWSINCKTKVVYLLGTQQVDVPVAPNGIILKRDLR